MTKIPFTNPFTGRMERRAWAKSIPRVHLWVTATNSTARLLYERCGFWPTAESQPLPSDPELIEIGMVRSR